MAARYLIVGLGKTGVSCARFLHTQGAELVLTDSRAEPPGLAPLRALLPDARCHLGGFTLAALDGVDTVIVSPGVSLREPLLQAAWARGLPLWSDIELFARHARAPIVAITGSNGKSTVTTLVGQMAAQAGRKVQVGGNLGTPALDLLTPTAELYVLELSSFQLETTHSLRPAAAVVLNISPDHLDRHEDMAGYTAAKARVYHQAQWALYNADDSTVAALATTPATASYFTLQPPRHERDYGLHQGYLQRGSTPLFPVTALKLAGLHNVANALAAWALGAAVGLPPAAMQAALQEFTGLPHRTQWVAEQAGVVWYNDSKGTNVGATIAALQGMTRPVILIAGGQGKGADFTLLRPAVAAQARAVVLLGEDAPLLATALQGVVPVVAVADMVMAVAAARKLAQPGDCVLLSPACASFDQFRGYEHRGQVYTAAVQDLLGIS